MLKYIATMVVALAPALGFSQVPDGTLDGYGVSCNLSYGEKSRVTTTVGEQMIWMQAGQSFSHSFAPNYEIRVSQVEKSYKGIAFPAWEVSIYEGQAYWPVSSATITVKDGGSFLLEVPVEVPENYMDGHGGLDRMILSCVSELMAG